MQDGLTAEPICAPAEGADVHPLFDAAWYRAANPDLRDDEICFGHYLTVGWRQSRSPHPLFSVPFYLGQRPDVRDAGLEPLVHFATEGWRHGACPHPLFDVAFYASQSPDLAGADPLSHYLTVGWRGGLRPNPLFDAQWRRINDPAGAAGDTEPLSRFVAQEGAATGEPIPFFDRLTAANFGLDARQDRNGILADLIDLARRGALRSCAGPLDEDGAPSSAGLPPDTTIDPARLPQPARGECLIERFGRPRILCDAGGASTAPETFRLAYNADAQVWHVGEDAPPDWMKPDMLFRDVAERDYARFFNSVDVGIFGPQARDVQAKGLACLAAGGVPLFARLRDRAAFSAAYRKLGFEASFYALPFERQFQLALARAPSCGEPARPSKANGPPRFSFVVPVYDRTQQLRESIRSLLLQSLDDFEVILVCDGSPAPTLEVVEELAEDGRVRVFRYADNSGNACRGRNKGIKMARGEFVCFHDSDDIAHYRRLERTRRTIDEGGAEAVYGPTRVLMDGSRQVEGIFNGQLFDPPPFDFELLKKMNLMMTCSVAVRRDLLLEFGGFREEMHYREDHELWLRLAHRGRRWVRADETLCYYRFHSGNAELTLRGDDSHWHERALALHDKPFAWP